MSTMADEGLEYWEVWFPAAAATGLLVGRCMIRPAQVLLVHAVPDVISVEVRTTGGERLAKGSNLKRTLESPICRLERRGDQVTRSDLWPGQAEIGLPVLLPGGEAGILTSWWNADDRLEWRWSIELYNSRR
jgi:hypothetical protein